MSRRDLPYLIYLGIAIVAITVVHQDALSESHDDWLVRPLLRRDLALAKVLFVLLTVNFPLMIIDVMQQLALNFPLSVSLGVAASRALIVVSMFSLPALMLGAVTRSLVDAFVFGFASAIGILLIVFGAVVTLSPNVMGLGRVAAMGWISLWAAAVTIIIGSAASLAFQYHARRLLVARGIGLAAVLAAVYMWILLPGTVILPIQQALWGSSSSEGIRLSFDPSSQRGGGGQEPGLGHGVGPPVASWSAAAVAATLASAGKAIQVVGLPLTISGMHPGDILVADRIDVRLVAMSGKVLYEGAGVCTRPNGTIISCARPIAWRCGQAPPRVKMFRTRRSRICPLDFTSESRISPYA